MLNLRIHGDNIIECERALELVAVALEAKYEFVTSPLYSPKYALKNKVGVEVAQIQLFPGYKRWGIDIQQLLKENGAPLREATDAIITRVTPKEEEVLFSIEFCNALPAGNNAWQRTGRALASGSVGIPYLHLSEIGGMELDGKRKLKAHRFPNPIIPFSYITLGKNYGSLTIPIYLPSPSSSSESREKFKPAFGFDEGVALIRGIIENKDTTSTVKALLDKNMTLVTLLSAARKRKNTFKDDEWKQFLELSSDEERVNWLEENGRSWSKKNSGKVKVTSSFKKLLSCLKKMDTRSIGAADIPICLLPSASRKELGERLKKIYKEKIDDGFLEWIEGSDVPLVIVWITGFKPKGEDSRPDRGLVPLARMLLGPDTEILSVVSGPAKKEMLDLLKKSPEKLAEQNGLWEAIINLSDGIIADCSTCKNSPISILTKRDKKSFQGKVAFDAKRKLEIFGEQDVDSVIHFLFFHSDNKNVFESMCNTPGGDWSGISVIDFKSGEEVRWTSLPRVSPSAAKRPDHVIELCLNGKNIALIAIESKDNATDLDKGIGPRLSRYVSDLLKSQPNVMRESSKEWRLLKKKWKLKERITSLSGGAFCYRDESELSKVLKRGNLDFVLALEYESGGKVVLHILANEKARFLCGLITELAKPLKEVLEIKVH